ncbi:hypothetical protein FA15DRAFT_698203 [Coprinopsis marcescibilis]|uniref:FAD-binding domain-containing protein n=1 Tax=Coprinopsis marcescibilis TaxID=230819 RepID=A0A5C3KDD9_COPMA|nr:hypothetical protein FA15DRAFT_698203 [Coprinopsis marcescibilis]
MDQDVSASKKRDGRTASVSGIHSLKDHYLGQLDLVPNLKKLLGTATLVDDCVKSASDYSYSADKYAGDRFRIIGDASAFIDPLFSSGVHLALLGGLTAASTIAASMRGHCSEQEAAEYHHIKVGAAYTRFFLVVMSAYQQIRSQSVDILSDVDEDNFDRAFDIIRPVIQGTADVGQNLTKSDLSKTLEFCQVSPAVWAPVDPEMQAEVSNRFGAELVNPAAPIFKPEELDAIIGSDDEDALNVIKRINARKVVDPIFRGTSSLETEVVKGFVTRLERGNLGLIQVSQQEE